MPDVRDFSRRREKVRACEALLHPEASDPCAAVERTDAEQLLHFGAQHRMRHRIFAAALLAWLASLVAGTASQTSRGFVEASQRLPAALLRNHPAISYERAPVSNA